MKLIRLTKDTIIKSFDCGDADLNDFILNDAKAFLSSSYPAIKLGRFAVSKNYRSLGIGTKIMDYLKMILFKSASYSAFRFLTVDAYISAIPFYERNGFKTLLPEEDDEHTRTMYFDILSLDES